MLSELLAGLAILLLRLPLPKHILPQRLPQCFPPPPHAIAPALCLLVQLGVKKDVESLAALEHEGISYAEFNKDFYDEAPEITALTHAQVGTHSCLD